MTAHCTRPKRYPLTQGVNPWLVTVSVMLPTFMEVLDTAIASVALPYIAGSLSASNSEATWVLTSYLVANAVILPASNWFARRFGRKQFLLTCVVIFTVASFFCGAAPSLAVILLARVLQGAGGGALQPLSQSILLESFPVAEALAGHGRLRPRHRCRAGARPHPRRLAHRYVQLALRVLHQHPGRHSGRLHDRAGSSTTRRISSTPRWAPSTTSASACWWSGPAACRWCSTRARKTTGSAPSGCAGRSPRWLSGCIGWIWRSWSNPRGLVDLHVLKNRNFRTGCFLIALLGMCIYITIAILPLYYQEILGYTAFTAGLVVGPRGIGSIHRLARHRHPGHAHRQSQAALRGIHRVRHLLALFRHREPLHRPIHAAGAHLITGFALSFVFVPLANLSTSTLSREEMGNATGLFNMLRNIGGSIGIAMATTALIRRAALHQNDLAGQISPSNPVLQQKSAQIAAYLAISSDAPAAAAPAPSACSIGMMQQQSALKAYVDVFRWTALLAFFCARRVAFQEAHQAHRSAAGRSLIYFSSLGCAQVHETTLHLKLTVEAPSPLCVSGPPRSPNRASIYGMTGRPLRVRAVFRGRGVGFSRFPWLTGDEGESQMQSPDPALSKYFSPHGRST